MKIRSLGIASIFLASLLLSPGGFAATPSAQSGGDDATGTPPANKNAAPAPLQPSKKEEKRRQESLKSEMEKPFQRWLDQDVAYIITDAERQAFKQLQNAEEREQFIEQFWARRDPTPDSVENEYREEHYRRIAYANEHFASGIAGWRTDRGRIYIMYGPPDEIESHAGGTYQRPAEEGGGDTSTFPFAIWRYHYIPGVGQEVKIEFVDKTQSGEYRMTLDPSEKDALLHVPGAGLTMLEQLGVNSKSQRFDRYDGTQRGTPLASPQSSTNEFERLQRFAALNRPPEAKFKDLETVVNSRISYNLLPFQARTDFMRITSETVLSAITVQLKVKDMTFTTKDGVSRGTVNIYGAITNLTGRAVQKFEDVVQVDIPAGQLEKYLGQSRVYWKALPLTPGLYRMNLVLKDINSGNLGTQVVALRVPRYEDDTLSASSLILADDIENISTREIGKGQFVIGSTKVRPAVDQRFDRSQNLGIYLQVYNLATDEKSHKPRATVEYSLSKDERPVMHWTETAEQVNGAGQQMTLEKFLTLKQLAPGTYKLQVTVTDQIAKQTIAPMASFRVE